MCAFGRALAALAPGVVRVARSRWRGFTRRGTTRRATGGFGRRRPISTRTHHPGSIKRPRAGAPKVAVATVRATAVSVVSSSVSKHCSFSSTCAPSIASEASRVCTSEVDVDVEPPRRLLRRRFAPCIQAEPRAHAAAALQAARLALVRAVTFEVPLPPAPPPIPDLTPEPPVHLPDSISVPDSAWEQLSLSADGVISLELQFMQYGTARQLSAPSRSLFAHCSNLDHLYFSRFFKKNSAVLDLV